MPRYNYGPPGAGAASLGMYGHLGPIRESKGPAPYGAASYGMYGGIGGGRGGKSIPKANIIRASADDVPGGDYHRSVRSGKRFKKPQQQNPLLT